MPPPAPVPQGDDRFLVDPRIGFDAPIPASLNNRLEAAWRYVLAGDDAEARRRLAEIRRQNPELAPAIVAEAALDIRQRRFGEARSLLAPLQQRHPRYTAARIHEAEILAREGNTRAAIDLYRTALTLADVPTVSRERLTQLEQALHAELVAAAEVSRDADAVRLLREALALQADALDARIALGRRLVALREYDEARRTIEPLLDTAADRIGVQEILAEVEAGRGQYQEAIVRYDRIVRRTGDPRHVQRLEEIKRKWSAANMPRYVNQALESPTLTRADFATLLYWLVPAVRFAQNLPAPPIATDIADVEGRDEIVRAIALGLFEVDSVTRRVSPTRLVTAARLSGYLTRVLHLRGAPCARGTSAQQTLAACRVTDPLSTLPPDAAVTGQTTARLLEQVAKAFD
jgi:tetratricopeptide (TPR) repeat protein